MAPLRERSGPEAIGSLDYVLLSQDHHLTIWTVLVEACWRMPG
jgi:hypothetical protein